MPTHLIPSRLAVWSEATKTKRSMQRACLHTALLICRATPRNHRADPSSLHQQGLRFVGKSERCGIEQVLTPADVTVRKSLEVSLPGQSQVPCVFSNADKAKWLNGV